MTRASGKRSRVLRDGRGGWFLDTPDYASEADTTPDLFETVERDASGRAIRNAANMTAEQLSAARARR